MNNSVTLYKTKYTIGTIEQPYFNSTSSRDSFLLTQSPYIVNLNQPNIHFDYELNLELVLPLDYTVAQSYNLAKIVYNSKEYFAYIVDMQQLSVGQVKFILHRAVLFENVDYFSKFKNFNISRSTFTAGYFYNRNTAYFKPEFRYYNKKRRQEFNILLPADISLYLYKNNKDVSLTFIDTLVIFFEGSDNAPGESIRDFYGMPANPKVLLLPLASLFKNINVALVSFCHTTTGSLRTTIGNYTYNLEAIKSYLVDKSASIVSVQCIKMPYGVFTYTPEDEPNYKAIFPFYYCKDIFASVDNGSIGFFLDSYSYSDPGDMNSFALSMSDKFSSPFGNITYYFNAPDAPITIDKALYASENANDVKFTCYLFISPNDSQMLIELTSTSADSVRGNQNIFKQTISLNASTFYFIDAASSFEAENRYYDAMTNSVRNEKLTRGLIQVGENAALGITQLAGAGKMVGNFSTDLQTAGISNIIRTVGKAADVWAEQHFYAEQRNIYKKNEKAKPDEFVGGDDGVIRAYTLNECPWIDEEIPFPADYSEWQSNIQLYGIECNLFETILEKSTKIVNNNMFIKALATMADDATLDAQTYNELYNFLKSGLLYNII